MTNTLSLNVNVAKAQAILGMVSSHTFVDRYLLLDDDAFGSMLTKYVNDNVPIAKAVVELTNYVNNNY